MHSITNLEVLVFWGSVVTGHPEGFLHCFTFHYFTEHSKEVRNILLFKSHMFAEFAFGVAKLLCCYQLMGFPVAVIFKFWSKLNERAITSNLKRLKCKAADKSDTMPLQSLLDESAKPTYASIGAVSWARRRHSVPIGAVGAVDSLSNEVECSAGTWFTLLKITWDLQTDKCYCSGGDRLSSSLQPSS